MSKLGDVTNAIATKLKNFLEVMQAKAAALNSKGVPSASFDTINHIPPSVGLKDKGFNPPR